MKILITVTREDENEPFGKFAVKPETNEELVEAAMDIVNFINESYEESEVEEYV